ncbi:hypothetical protein Tco_0377741, partial [Tanacetum coccineum]
MYHGCMINHGLIMEYGRNRNHSSILASLSTIKLDVRNGQPVVGERMVIVMEEICPVLTILETRSITKTLNVMMNQAMIVGKDGRAMRFTTTIMMKGNMKTKLIKKDMSCVILSDLKKAQVQKGSKRNQETKPGSRYSRRTKPKVPILTRFQAISSRPGRTSILSPISSLDPITPPTILTPSPVLPPSLLFDPRYFFVPEELLPPKKQIHSPSSSSTTLSNSSRNQTCNLVSPSSSVYTPTPPQIFEIGKCSIKMYLKHHEEQIEDILNYLEELSFHRIEKMEEGRINGNELKTELKEIRTQIIKLQKKRLGQKDKIAFAHYRISDLERIIEKIQALDRMPPKRTSTSETPAITLDAIRQLIDDGISSALKAQAAAMATFDNSNRNIEPREIPVAKRGNYKEFINLSTSMAPKELLTSFA